MKTPTTRAELVVPSVDWPSGTWVRVVKCIGHYSNGKPILAEQWIKRGYQAMLAASPFCGEKHE